MTGDEAKRSRTERQIAERKPAAIGQRRARKTKRDTSALTEGGGADGREQSRIVVLANALASKGRRYTGKSGQQCAHSRHKSRHRSPPCPRDHSCLTSLQGVNPSDTPQATVQPSSFIADRP